MAFYRVLLSGTDFLFDSGFGPKKSSFFTTRWVKANTPEEAELKAVELIKNDESLLAKVVKSESSQPMIHLEEMYKVNWFEYFRKNPGKGYTFY